jgi:predicted DNA-binding transcriptional regulator AlpA
MRKMVGKQRLKEFVPLSDSTIWRLERGGKFPKRVNFPGSSRVGWFQDEIEAYQESLKSGPGNFTENLQKGKSKKFENHNNN